MNGKAKRSGTEKRKRSPRVYSRVTDAERQQIERDAAARGLKIGGYLRSLAIDNPETRPLRRPVADVALLAQVKGQMGRIGGNIHQLVKRANRGEILEPDEVREAFKEFRELLATAAEALKGA